MKQYYYFAVKSNGWIVYKGTIDKIAFSIPNVEVWQSNNPIKSPFPTKLNEKKYTLVALQ